MVSVLVGYASAHGSTEEIAGRIADRLAVDDIHVDLRRMTDVREIGGYDAVVLGSAVHNQRWLPEAAAAVKRLRSELLDKPLWAFSVGMPGALPRALRSLAMREEAEIRGLDLESLHPRDHHLFTGVIRPEHLPLFGRVVMRVMGVRFGDFRDWAEIDRWTDEVAAALHGHQVAT
ncbi:flavodoxin domain-containing protein [Kutzneria buriramensis]|uniref:Menaquinone-dependent protoporphyrinogen oxidase n=1 Tax=Kutzneria buriramensis TaxID=1045776 RepID=A0A3E0GY07_9PSEU|nr:flavodoxin domain-containing protein [Kutzneria buriramensis]REH34837.1 menaquinone-dependent protoporphyrinogen oxidase [Kutzneria buriramensis]